MNIECLIRFATNEDSSAISDLIFNIWINEYNFKVEKEGYPDLCEIKNYYFDRGGVFLVATIDNEVVGTVACDPINRKIFILKRMFVHKDFRGQGIAQKLLDELQNQIAVDHKCCFYLSTKEGQAMVAKHFYLKNGFKIIQRSELPQGFPFFYEDDLFMKKEFN